MALRMENVTGPIDRTDFEPTNPVFEAAQEMCRPDFLQEWGFSAEQAAAATIVHYMRHRRHDVLSSTVSRLRMSAFEGQPQHFRLQYRSDDEFNLPDAIVTKTAVSPIDAIPYPAAPEELAGRMWEIIDAAAYATEYDDTSKVAVIHLLPPKD